MTWARNLAEERERKDERRVRNMAALLTPSRSVSRGTYAKADATQADPKEPSERNMQLRQLACGEICCGCAGASCDPATTVWAHSNKLADGKGRGYKSSDEKGAFLGANCHRQVDERTDGPAADLLFALAQSRTHIRLAEIAASPALKPWKIEAAKWALKRLEPMLLDTLDAARRAGL